MSDPQVFVGIDVSKAQLDVALRPTDECWHVNNDESGIAGLVERLGTVQPTLIVLEATGGLEVPAAGALARGRSACGGRESSPRTGFCQSHRPLGQDG
jgi:transposase